MLIESSASAVPGKDWDRLRTILGLVQEADLSQINIQTLFRYLFENPYSAREPKLAEYSDIDFVLGYFKSRLSLNEYNSNGLSLLHLAIENGLCDVIQLLLSHGADQELKSANDNPETPLQVLKHRFEQKLLPSYEYEELYSIFQFHRLVAENSSCQLTLYSLGESNVVNSEMIDLSSALRLKSSAAKTPFELESRLCVHVPSNNVST
jgi:ankyrin repeat protein